MCGTSHLKDYIQACESLSKTRCSIVTPSYLHAVEDKMNNHHYAFLAVKSVLKQIQDRSQQNDDMVVMVDVGWSASQGEFLPWMSAFEHQEQHW